MENEVIAHEEGAPITKGWHLDKRITISHLLTTLAFVVGLGSALYALDTRVTHVENGLQTHKQIVDLQIEAINDIDRSIMIEQNKHYNDIIVRLTEQTRRLERIEDGVNRHIRDAQQILNAKE
jgi:hypothetical protein